VAKYGHIRPDGSPQIPKLVLSPNGRPATLWPFTCDVNVGDTQSVPASRGQIQLPTQRSEDVTLTALGINWETSWS
jgi:hypothetical protein